MNGIKISISIKIIYIILLISLFLNCSSIPENKDSIISPIIGVWKSHDNVTLYDESNPPAIFAEFTVDTTMTVFSDGKFHLLNELEDSNPNGPFTGTEEYTGTWNTINGTEYEMRADDIDTWGDGTGAYNLSSDSFSTVWVEPRGTFNTSFTRFE